MKSDLLKAMEGVKSVAIAGHTRPDGDCIGSVMGLYNYIKDNLKDVEADAYLEAVPGCFDFIPSISDVKHFLPHDKEYDLFVLMDTSDEKRTGVAGELIKTAKELFIVDHHISNSMDVNLGTIEPSSSSTCEVLFGLLPEEKISLNTAVCLFTGIVTDTGCFHHSNTGRETMEIAGKLLDKGVENDVIIDRVFYEMTFTQNKLLGECLKEAKLLDEGLYIYSVASKNLLLRYDAKASDLESVVNQLRVTKGAEVAVFFTEIGEETYKISLRSNGRIDVNAVASLYGGGGHILASGCTVKGIPEKIMEEMTVLFNKQLETCEK